VRRLVICLVVSVLSFNTVQAETEYQVQPAADWVVPVTIPTQWSSAVIPDELKGQSVHYKLVDQQSYFDAAGNYLRYRNYIETPLSQSGLESSGSVEIAFKPDYHHVTLHHVAIIRDGERFDRLESARISVLDIEPESENNLYTGQAKLLVLLNDYRLGDTLDIAYTVSGRNPVMGEKLITSFSLGWSVPVEKIHRRLTVPTSKKLNFRTYILDTQPTIEANDLTTSYTLLLEKTPAYREDSGSPGFANSYPYIAFSEYETWQEVTDWARPLFQYDGLENNEMWQQWRQEILAQDSDMEKVTHALRLVQDNIRYVGIELGENSHRPHSPQETLKNAYGDCKDKTLLLVSLLNSIGLEAEPFLVNTKSTKALVDWLPSPYSFNHVITRVVLGNELHYIDPTLSYQAGTDIAEQGYYNYSVGLPVYRPAGLVEMPVRANSTPQIRVSQDFQGYGFNLPALLTSVSVYTHDQADRQRYRIANTPVAELEQNYTDFYSKTYGNTIVAESIDIMDNTATNQVTITMKLWVDDFYEYNEEQQRYQYSVVAYSINDYLDIADRQIRATPLWIAQLTNIDQRMTVHHPKLYDPTGIESLSYSLKNEHFNFSVHSQEYRNKAKYQFVYQNYKNSVEPEDMTNYTEQVREAREHLSYFGWYNAKSSPSSKTANEQFFQKLLMPQ